MDLRVRGSPARVARESGACGRRNDRNAAPFGVTATLQPCQIIHEDDNWSRSCIGRCDGRVRSFTTGKTRRGHTGIGRNGLYEGRRGRERKIGAVLLPAWRRGLPGYF